MTFGYDYFFWASDLAAETRVSATFFFDHRKGLRQALARNLLTRLYKVVEMTVDESLDDKYELTKFVFDNPALRRIVYYPNMDGEKSSRTFIRAIKRLKDEKPELQISMKLFEKARLQFSAYSHINMIECMDEKDVENYLDKEKRDNPSKNFLSASLPDYSKVKTSYLFFSSSFEDTGDKVSDGSDLKKFPSDELSKTTILALFFQEYSLRFALKEIPGKEYGQLTFEPSDGES